MATEWIRDKDELAKTITTMSFGELLETAKSLVEMNENGERATEWIKDSDELAATITNMTFGELLAVAGSLVEMNENGERDISTPLGMARTLWDWAEATREEAGASSGGATT